MLPQLSKVTIPVKDVDRAIDFFTRKVGFTLASDAPFGPGLRWVEVAIPGQAVQLVLWAGPTERPEYGRMANALFQTGDIQKTYDALKARGVVFPQPPKQESWGVNAVFQDLEGNAFSLALDQRQKK